MLWEVTRGNGAKKCLKMKIRRKHIILLFTFLIGILVSEVKGEVLPGDTIKVAYKLHGQTRRFRFVYEPDQAGGLILKWDIMRNLKLWTGSYAISKDALEKGNAQSYIMPEDGNYIRLGDKETFALISREAYSDLCKKGEFDYNGVSYKRKGNAFTSFGEVIEVEDLVEGGKMKILNNNILPLIVSMKDNPLEIDWEMTK